MVLSALAYGETVSRSGQRCTVPVEKIRQELRHPVACMGEVDADRLVNQRIRVGVQHLGGDQACLDVLTSPYFANHRGAVIAVRRRYGSGATASSCNRS